MAALLGKTVEASIELGNIMDINPAEAQDDTLRVALAGLAGPLVAGQFRKRGQIPEGTDVKKITGALQAVLTFSDNFAPTPETVERLKKIEAEGQIVDGYQTQIQYMQAFIPVIEAIAAFPFGQAEAKLIMDVSDRLVKKSVELREALLPGVGDEAIEKRAELGLLRALAHLYSACHKAETEKVLNMDEDARTAGLSMDPVWAAFDVRAAMLESLAAKMVPGHVASGGASAPIAPVAPVDAPQAPAETPPPIASPVTPPVKQPPVAPSVTPPPEQAAPPAGQNPMAGFAKPQNPVSAPVTPPAETPPATPPPEQAAPPVQPPPTAAPPTSPPAQTDEQSGEQGDTQGQGGNPMGFFKKGDK